MTWMGEMDERDSKQKLEQMAEVASNNPLDLDHLVRVCAAREKELVRLTERLKTAEDRVRELEAGVNKIMLKSYEPDPERPALSTRNEIQLMAEDLMASTIRHTNQS